MINWISNWAQGIIVAVIIGTIIEMVLPEGNCKKYVKVVIGIYILFSIISPVISKMTGKTLQVSDILELDKYIENVENNNLYGTLDKDNTNNIKEIYINSLKNDIKYKIEAKGYTVGNVELEVQKNEEYTLYTDLQRGCFGDLTNGEEVTGYLPESGAFLAEDAINASLNAAQAIVSDLDSKLVSDDLN